MAFLRPLLESRGLPGVLEAMEAVSIEDPRRPTSPEVREFLRRRFLASAPAGLLGMGDALLDEPDRVDALRAAGLPTLVAHGAEDDAWLPPVQEDMAARLGARYAVVPDSWHSPAAENPEPTARVLLDFWAAVPV